MTTFFLLEIHFPYIRACTDPEKFARGGPTLTFFFLLLFFASYEGREDLNSTKRGTSPAKWRFAGGPMMAQR